MMQKLHMRRTGLSEHDSATDEQKVTCVLTGILLCLGGAGRASLLDDVRRVVHRSSLCD
jgi:hypothetical protein